MRTTACILALLSCIPSTASAGPGQYRLTREANLPRNGDRLVGQVAGPVEYCALGENVLWDFSGLSLLGRAKPVSYASSGDSMIVAIENGQYSYYTMCGDTAFLFMQRAQGKRLGYERPEQVMTYPLGYHCSSGDYFYSEGSIDGSTFIRQAGYSNVGVSASGRMITPDGDSLRHVLLVRYVRHGTTDIIPDTRVSLACTGNQGVTSVDNINSILASDSVTHRLEILRWYARGVRYPVLEISIVKTFYYGEPSDSVVSTTYYSPAMQRRDLEHDELNDSLFAADMSEPFLTGVKSGPSQDRGNTPPCSSNLCTLYPTIVSSVTTVGYTAVADTRIDISVYSAAGSLVSHSSEAAPFGRGNVTLRLDSLTRGTYLVTVLLGDNKFYYKIFKE